MKTRLQLTAFALLLFLLLNECEKNTCSSCTCGTEDPHLDLDWLKKQLELRFCTEVYATSFNGKDYITLSDCPETRDGMSVMFDCKGNKVCEWGGMNPGGNSCNLPSSFTSDYYYNHRKLIHKQEDYEN